MGTMNNGGQTLDPNATNQSYSNFLASQKYGLDNGYIKDDNTGFLSGLAKSIYTNPAIMAAGTAGLGSFLAGGSAASSAGSGLTMGGNGVGLTGATAGTGGAGLSMTPGAMSAFDSGISLGGAAAGSGASTAMGGSGSAASPSATNYDLYSGPNSTGLNAGATGPAGGGLSTAPGDSGIGLTAAANGGGPAIGQAAATAADAAAGTSPGILSQLGGTSGILNAAKNYGPVVFAGLEYANRNDAAKAYQDQLQHQIAASDPFGPQRAQYQKQLQDLISNPSSFFNSPMVQYATDAAARKSASMGYNLSPAQAQAVQDTAISKYNDQANLLAGLSGSGIAPNLSSLNGATQNAVSGQLNSDAAMGNLFRTAINAIPSGGTNSSNSSSTVGGRSFSLLDNLV